MSARSWETYVVVLLSGFLALFIPVALSLLSRSLRVNEKRKAAPAFSIKGAKDRGSSNVSALGQRVNFRFFLAVNASLALLGLALMLVPLVSVLRAKGSDPQLIYVAAMAIFSVSGLLGVALLYAGRKGDLSWLHTQLRRREKS